MKSIFRRGTFKKIHLIQVSFLLFFLLAVSSFYFFTNRYVNKQLYTAKTYLFQELENKYNIEIHYKSLSPSILSSIVIRDLQVISHSEKIPLNFNADKVNIFYNPLQFLSKRSSTYSLLDIIGRVSINGGTLSLYLNNQSSEQKNKELIIPSNLVLPDIDLVMRNFQVDIYGKDFKTSSNITRLFLQDENDQLRLRLRSDNSIYINTEKETQILTADLSGKGKISKNLESFNLNTDMRRLKYNTLEMVPQSFSISLNDGLAVVNKIKGNYPFNLNFQYDFNQKSMMLSGDFEEFIPGELIKKKDSVAYKWLPWLNSVITGSAEVSYLLESKDIHYIFDGEIIVDNEKMPFPVTLTSDLEGDKVQADIALLNITSEVGDLSFSGNFLFQELVPQGEISLTNVDTPFDYKLNSRLGLSFENNFLLIKSLQMTAGDIQIEDFQILLERHSRQFEGSLYLAFPNLDDAIPQELLMDIIFQLGDIKELSCNLSLYQLKLDTLLYFLGKKQLRNSLTDKLNINTSIDLLARYGLLEVSFPEVEITRGQNQDRVAFLSGFYDSKHFYINHMETMIKDQLIEGNVTGQFENSLITADINLNHQANVYSLNCIYSKETGLTISGNHGIYGSLTTNGNISDFSFQSRDLPLDLKWGRSEVGFAASGSFGRKKNLEILIQGLKLVIPNDKNGIKPEFSGNILVTSHRIELLDVVYKDLYSTLNGYGTVFVEDYAEKKYQGWIVLQETISEQKETYQISALGDGTNINAAVKIMNFPFYRIPKAPLQGAASIDGSIQGTYSDPEIALSVKCLDSRYKDKNLSFDMDLEYSKNLVSITSLDAVMGKNNISGGLVLFNLKDLQYQGTAEYTFNYFDTKITADLTASGNLDSEEESRFWQDPTLDGNVLFSNLFWYPDLDRSPEMKHEIFPEQQLTFHKEPQFFSIKDRNSENLEINVDSKEGKITGFLSPLYPISGIVDGTISSTDMDLNINNLIIQTQLINYLMRKDPFLRDLYVVFKEGTIQGDVSIKGEPSDPYFYGKLAMVDVLPDTPFTRDPIGYVNTNIELNEKDMVLDPFSIPVGEGEIYTRASFIFDRWVPLNYNLDIELRNLNNSDGIHIAYPIKGIALDGHVIGKLNLNGTRTGIDIIGDLTFPQLKVTLKSAPEKADYKGTGYPYKVLVDLDLNTGRNVFFDLSVGSNQLLETLITPAETVSILYDNYTSDLSFKGDLTLKSGTINFLGNNFFLKEGFISFNENSTKFNPFLSVLANIKSSDQTGEEVDISLIFDGPMKKFSPRFLSSPVRSQTEILAMLGQSFSPQQDEEENLLALGSRTLGNFIVNPALIKPLEDTVQETSGLDVFNFRTSIIENVILDRVFYNDYYAEDNSSLSVGRLLNNTSIFLGKYLGDNLFLSGSLLLQYEENGSSNTFLGDSDLSAIFNIGIEMQTPFFNIGWNYSPGSTGESFVADNEVSIKWKFSY